MCNSTGQRSTGAVLYILGLLIAGVMFMVIGSEYNKDPTDYDHLKTYFWVYAISMLIGTIGLILDNGDRFCGEEEFKDVDYFGGLFQVVAGFAWAGFGVGMAHYYEAGVLNLPSTSAAADERGNLAYLSGVAAIFYAFGSLFTLKRLLCCEGFSCDMASIFNIVNMLLCILLIVFWFVFADKLEKDPLLQSGDKDRRTFSYLLGVVYILMGLMGSLLVLDVCGCGGGDDKPIKPSYGDDYGKPDYGKPDYGKPSDGYGKPSYGDDTTTGYGSQPQPPQNY
jgi:hypothetical protein